MTTTLEQTLQTNAQTEIGKSCGCIADKSTCSCKCGSNCQCGTECRCSVGCSCKK